MNLRQVTNLSNKEPNVLFGNKYINVYLYHLYFCSFILTCYPFSPLAHFLEACVYFSIDCYCLSVYQLELKCHLQLRYQISKKKPLWGWSACFHWCFFSRIVRNLGFCELRGLWSVHENLFFMPQEVLGLDWHLAVAVNRGLL